MTAFSSNLRLCHLQVKLVVGKQLYIPCCESGIGTIKRGAIVILDTHKFFIPIGIILPLTFGTTNLESKWTLIRRWLATG